MSASSKINLSLVTLGAIKDWLMNVAIVAPPFLSMSRRSRRPALSLRQTDQAVHALACTHRDSWICCYEPDKKDVGVRRPPTAFLLPIVARTEIRRFRVKGRLRQNYPMWPRFVK